MPANLPFGLSWPRMLFWVLCFFFFIWIFYQVDHSKDKPAEAVPTAPSQSDAAAPAPAAK